MDETAARGSVRSEKRRFLSQPAGGKRLSVFDLYVLDGAPGGESIEH